MTRARDRILISVFGSGGDLFPLVPVMRRLVELGHEVLCAVPRVLGLYLRTQRIATLSLGSGSEMRVFDDERLVTTRFDGWSSWRDLMERYVRPSLGDDVASLTKAIDEWRPHVLVSSSFATAARLAAFHRHVPHVGVSIYPQLLARLPASRSFASSFRQSVRREIQIPVDAEQTMITELAWGVSDDSVLLHDAALLTSGPGQNLDVRAVGFPYFDGFSARPEDGARVEAWLPRSTEPVVLVTAGSFLGVRQAELWAAAARAINRLGIRGLFVGPHSPELDRVTARSRNILAVGFVPLSQLAPRVAAVVHHGGIGTMFATLLAGRPAAVVPQAFDQLHNARLVTNVGVGIDASQSSLDQAVTCLLNDRTLKARAEQLARQLTPADVAVSRVVERVLGQASEGCG